MGWCTGKKQDSERRGAVMSLILAGPSVHQIGASYFRRQRHFANVAGAMKIRTQSTLCRRDVSLPQQQFDNKATNSARLNSIGAYCSNH